MHHLVKLKPNGERQYMLESQHGTELAEIRDRLNRMEGSVDEYVVWDLEDPDERWEIRLEVVRQVSDQAEHHPKDWDWTAMVGPTVKFLSAHKLGPA